MGNRTRVVRGVAAVGSALFIGIVVRGFILPELADHRTLLGSFNVVPRIHASRSVDVGDLAPDFKVTSEREEPVRLSEFRGRWVVLVFLRAHW